MQFLNALLKRNYDNLTPFTSQMFNTPIAFIRFIDTEETVLDGFDTEQNLSGLCVDAINDPSNVMVVRSRCWLRQSAVTVGCRWLLVNGKMEYRFGTLCVMITSQTLTDVQIAAKSIVSTNDDY
jgi:hypothetical protein